MAKRINARIDDELADKLAEVERLTGHGTSKIIKLALDAYIERLRATTAAPKHGLADFVGCADGESDLSARYKDALAESWNAKT